MRHGAKWRPLSRKMAEEFIAWASNELRGPMPDLERALIVEDRKDARAYIAELDAQAKNED